MIPDLSSEPSHDFEQTIKSLQTKYRTKYRQFLSLEGDVEHLYNNTRKNFFLTLVPTWAFIYYRQASGKPLYFLRQYGRIFGTHRVFRLYSYSFAAIYTCYWARYNRILKLTTQKLKDTHNIRSNPEYINYDVDMPQMFDISGKVMPYKKIN